MDIVKRRSQLRWVLVLSLLVVFVSSGCSTFDSRRGAHGFGGERMYPVYSGVRLNVEYWRLIQTPMFRLPVIILAPYLIIDFPCSLVADTLMLPITIPEARRLDKEKEGRANRKMNVAQPASAGDVSTRAPRDPEPREK
jgi:uncharacterized protein YceK